jgi:hypothetical protein
VLFQRLPDGAVLFDAATEVYFGLDPVGARVWELLAGEAGGSLEELCAALVREYPDADPDVVRADVGELLGELARHGLVLPSLAGADDAAELAGARR